MNLDSKLTKAELHTYEKLRLKWKELSIEDIILDGLYLNCVRLVKEYCDRVLKIDLKQSKIHDIGLKSVLQLLADKDLRGAEILLNNMSFDPNQKIYQICFFTLYKQLRDYLISILIDRQKLNQNELEMVKYLKKFEMVYSCRSFETAKQNVNKFNLKISGEVNKNFKTNDLITFRETNINENVFGAERLLYSQIALEWIREWSPELREEILADGLIVNYENSEVMAEIRKLNPNILFSVLLDQNNVKLLLEWIDFSYGDNDDEKSDTTTGIFSSKITQTMVDYLDSNQRVFPDTKDILLNQLAKYNILSTNETSNMNRQIARLVSSNTFFEHKLFRMRDISWHSNFIHSFGNNIPPHFAWLYNDFYCRTMGQSEFFTGNETLKLMQAFRRYDKDDFMVDMTVKNFNYIIAQTDDGAEKKKALKDYSDLFSPENKEDHLVALALSLYSNTPITPEQEANIEHLTEKYPALRLLMNKKVSDKPPSMYDLLQQHSKLDMTKVFKWQKMNSIGQYDNVPEDKRPNCDSDMIPSFEDEKLVKQYAYVEELDYSYFVKQGRPFFAYNHFINSQLEKHGKTNKTLMEEARLRISLILIDSFDEQRIVSSCIMFGELINANTFKLKLNVHLMQTLYDYYIRRGMEPAVSREKCRHTFTEVFKEELDPEHLVSIFEQVLVDTMIEKFDQKNMFTVEASETWLPLMCFCKINNLPYTSKYLQLCAESNDWLMFLMFSQIYQIPRFQVISCLEYFQDIGLKQHLEYALHNVINSNSNSSTSEVASVIPQPKNNKKRTKKTKPLNSRIIADKSTDEESSSGDYEASVTSADQYENSLDSIDFYELLINCQNVPDPILQLQLESLRWYTPVLSVFATFYEQHDKISCLCTFLYSSMMLTCPNINALLQASKNTTTSGKSVLFGLNELKEVVLIAASSSYLRTLLNALKIFIPNTILDIYVEFLYNVFVNKDVETAKKLYQMYRIEFTKITLNKHKSYIPLEWYEEVINKIMRITLLKCQTADDLHNLNKILPKGNDYSRLIKLIDILKANKISVNSEDWLDIDDKSEQFNDICLKVIEELLKKEKFNEAEELAKYCELSPNIFHRIHLARIGRQIEDLRVNNEFEEILTFWQSAHLQLMKIGIKDSDFIDFLKFQNKRSHLIIERIVLLNLISQLCPNDQETSRNLWQLLLNFVNDHKKKNELAYLKEIFKKMLLFKNLKNEKSPIRELLDYVIEEGVANDFSDHNKSINEQDRDALNILLLNLVEIGKLKQAYVIAKHFKYYNQDLRILLNMLYICMDMIKPNELNYTLDTFDSTAYKGIRLTNVLRSLSRQNNNPNEILKDKIDALEKLAGLCSYGHFHCGRIKLDFRLANEYLNIPYTKLLAENEWKLLRNILYNTSSLEKFEMARKFAKTYDLNQNVLCDFMLKEVLATLEAYVESRQDTLSNNNSNGSNANNQRLPNAMLFDPVDNEQFSNLIKIFKPNSNQFGLRMYEKSRLLLGTAKTTNDYVILTELLIRSYSFFSQSCSMEGISNVLQTCKLCATQLERAGEFNIMIRLLTGIGHFNEMTYIMDYLWNNNQFEMLFGKGIGKNDKLRLALLDYLKRYHPNDHETYTMVTLNFTMHREIAIMLEEAAYQQLKLLENKEISQTPEILTDLQSILQYFSDAAQSFMKEDCVKHAECCIKKARLIALQIKFLSKNLVVINLSNAAASKFILNHSNFWESFIVSEAYEKISEWPQVLFQQFIIGNNVKYLSDFRKHILITPQMIEEVSNRFKLANEANGRMSPYSVANMKELLKSTKDIVQYYRIATSLEFHDLVTEMQKQPNFTIINDLILNKKI